MGSGSHSTPTIGSGSRAARPGSRAVRLTVACALVAAVAVLAVIGLNAGGGSSKLASAPAGSGAGGSTHSAPAGGSIHAARPTPIPAGAYGYIPSWLPQSKVPVSRVVTATPAHPWLAIQGDTVKVVLADVHVLATAAGPSVPEIGHFPLPRTTPCTFTVTLADASGPVPIKQADFATIDELGRLHSLRLRRMGGGPVPAELRPGQTVTLQLSTVLPTGEGRFMWAPVTGRPVVQWDFDVEID